MKTCSVIPAYGRDYKSRKEALADFDAGKDFILMDFFSPWDGKPCTKKDLAREYSAVQVRYARKTRIAYVKL